MLCKVTHCAGRVSANTRPHQLQWGDQEMGLLSHVVGWPVLPWQRAHVLVLSSRHCQAVYHVLRVTMVTHEVTSLGGKP